MWKHPRQQSHVSIDGNTIYALHNMPIDTLGTWNWKIAFGRGMEVLGIKPEDIAVSVNKTAGSRDGKWTSEVDGTVRGGRRRWDLKDFWTVLITNHW